MGDKKEKNCFVIMPFGKRGTEEHRRNLKVYRLMIKPVLENCGYRSIRSDEVDHPGSITRDIIELLYESDLVVADLSGKNPNVFYELGVRHVLFKCGTIQILEEGESLPFDIANYKVIYYSSELDGPERFKKELEIRIKAFERMNKERPDNPVHDILRSRLDGYDAIKKHRQQLKNSDALSKNHLFNFKQKKRGPARKLNEEEVLLALRKTGGNKSKASRLLNIGRATLYRYLKNDFSDIMDRL